MYSHLENIGSLNYAHIPNVDIFLYISKITSIKIITDFIRKAFQYQEAITLTVADILFPKF